MKNYAARLAAVCLAAMLILAGCGSSAEESSSLQEAEGSSSASSLPSSSSEPSSSAEESAPESSQEQPPESSGSAAPVQQPAPAQVVSTPDPSVKPFDLSMDASFDLYAYNFQKVGYVWLGNPADGDQTYPLMEAAIAVLNGLPALETTENVPFVNANYELMVVESNNAKTRYLLYTDVLEVNGTGYVIDSEQYEALKAVMGVAYTAERPAIPAWFLYMNPKMVTTVRATDRNGVMKTVAPADTLLAATILKREFWNIISAETYRPETIDFSAMPFREEVISSTGTSYTIAIGDTSADTVKVYVECNTMEFACEYTYTGAQMASVVEEMHLMLDRSGT